MSLYTQLQHAKSEEDVKDAYIKALGLKRYTKGLIDIRTDEIWFEAKDTSKHSSYAMFTQLLHYVQAALDKGETIPPFLAVIDTEKAALMKTADVLPFLKKKTVKWGKSASQYTQAALAEISAYIGTHFVSFRIKDNEEEFISTVKAAIQSGDIIRTQITPDNLKQVFDKWVEMIAREINGVTPEDYALLFFADIMHDGTVSTHANLPAELLHKNNAPVFSLGGKLYELGNKEGYRRFWAIYHKPPKAEYRNYLLERRDSLIPLDERSFKGAYYTPLAVVDKAYDKLAETLGKNWQREYIVWDMCCGVGNLEVKHSNPRNIYMSTLDQADIDVMKATKTCVAATRFQYDYLNDDIVDASNMSEEIFTPSPVRGELVEPPPSTSSGRTLGSIDYTLTNKVPLGLRKAIAEGKKILVLINPPYAEAMNADNVSIAGGKNAESKLGVSKTRVAGVMDKQGYAARELFVQFLVRIAQEMPTATVAIFSTLKYVNAPNFDGFREAWNAKYLGGFVIHSKSFDGLKGNFPIGFLVWQTANPLVGAQFIARNGKDVRDINIAPTKLHQITEITTEVLDKNAQAIGEKCFYNLPNAQLLSNWIVRPKANAVDALPLKNAISPTTSTKDVRGSKWADGAIASMICPGGDIQHAGLTALLSSGYCSAGGFFVTAENLWQAAIVFSVRRLIKQTWLNDRDQFLQPTTPLSDEFKSDCLIWMLFNSSNLTAGADKLEWNDKKWSLVNHFIPYTETEVGAPERFESDFMVQYLADLPALPPSPQPSPARGEGEAVNRALSAEAQAVLDAGRTLWQAYFAHTDVRAVRDELKLNRPDVGWYQIRNALKKRNASGDFLPLDFSPFEQAYQTLSDKLRPQVFELGFLK